MKSKNSHFIYLIKGLTNMILNNNKREERNYYKLWTNNEITTIDFYEKINLDKITEESSYEKRLCSFRWGI